MHKIYKKYTFLMLVYGVFFLLKNQKEGAEKVCMLCAEMVLLHLVF